MPEVADEVTQEREVDPDAPEGGILEDGDAMGHQMCETWMSALPDDVELSDAVEDAAWYADQADLAFISDRPTGGNFIEDEQDSAHILCGWNGYEIEEGSPADLLR